MTEACVSRHRAVIWRVTQAALVGGMTHLPCRSLLRALFYWNF